MPAPLALLLLLLLLLLLAGGVCSASGLELRGAVVVTRHGDRSALHPVPNALTPGLSADDRARLVGFPWGDLTTRGEEQHRRLGARARCRYGALVGDRYDAGRVYARSTASDRTLRSGQAFLIGLFSDRPAECDDAAGPYPFHWTAETATDGGLQGTGGGDKPAGQTAQGGEVVSPVWGGAAGRTAALHSVPKDQDTLLRSFDLCPRYQQLLGELHDGHEWLVKEELELQPGGTLAAWRSVVDAAGLKHDIEQTWSLWCFVPLFDSINVLLNHGLADALPPALIADDGALLKRAAQLYHWCRSRKYGPAPQLGRVSGGLLLRAIRHRLEALAHAAEAGGIHEEGEEVEEAGLGADGGPGGAPLTPFTLYSAHDSTLMSLCAALGAPLGFNPPYASALAIELWEHNNDGKTLEGGFGGKDTAARGSRWMISLSLNGETLEIPGADCVMTSSSSSLPLQPLEQQQPACLIELDWLLRATEATVPDEYDATSWQAECNAEQAPGEEREGAGLDGERGAHEQNRQQQMQKRKKEGKVFENDRTELFESLGGGSGGAKKRAGTTMQLGTAAAAAGAGGGEPAAQSGSGKLLGVAAVGVILLLYRRRVLRALRTHTKLRRVGRN